MQPCVCFVMHLNNRQSAGVWTYPSGILALCDRVGGGVSKLGGSTDENIVIIYIVPLTTDTVVPGSGLTSTECSGESKNEGRKKKVHSLH